MKFIIVAGQDPVVRSKPIFIDRDLDRAINLFTSIDSNKYKHGYLIVDFEYINQDEYSFILARSKQLNFLILAEYNYYSREKFIFRKDVLHIKTDGILEEFYDNTEAIRKFTLLWHNNIPTKLFMSYTIDDKYDSYESLIADSVEMNNRIDSNSNCIHGVIIDPYDIESMKPFEWIKPRIFTKEEYIKNFKE